MKNVTSKQPWILKSNRIRDKLGITAIQKEQKKLQKAAKKAAGKGADPGEDSEGDDGEETTVKG